MSVELNFSKPQKAIDRAKRALREADLLLRVHFGPDNVRFVTEVDEKTGDNVRKAILGSSLPLAVEDNVSNALINLRHSFDQSIFAACKTIGKLTDKNYPWASSPSDLMNNRLWDKVTGKEKIPSEFWDVIKAQQPYPRGIGYSGGLGIIRTVATFANRKHDIGIEVLGVSAGFANSIEIGFLTESFSVPASRWQPTDREAVVMRWRGERPKINGPKGAVFEIGFDVSAPKHLQRKPAIPILTDFAKYAQLCLDGLKARCFELGFS